MLIFGKKAVKDFEMKQLHFVEFHSNKQTIVFINSDGLVDIRLSEEDTLTEQELFELGVYYREMERGNAFLESIVGDRAHRVAKILSNYPRTILGKMIEQKDWD